MVTMAAKETQNKITGKLLPRRQIPIEPKVLFTPQRRREDRFSQAACEINGEIKCRKSQRSLDCSHKEVKPAVSLIKGW